MIYSSNNWILLSYSCELQTDIAHCPLDGFNCIHCRNWIIKTAQNKIITFVSNLPLLLSCVFQWMALKSVHSFKPRAGMSTLLSCLSSSFTHSLTHRKALVHLLYLSMSFHTQGHYPRATILSSLNCSYSFIIGLLDFSLAHPQSKFFSEPSQEHVTTSLYKLKC